MNKALRQSARGGVEETFEGKGVYGQLPSLEDSFHTCGKTAPHSRPLIPGAPSQVAAGPAGEHLSLRLFAGKALRTLLASRARNSTSFPNTVL